MIAPLLRLAVLLAAMCALVAVSEFHAKNFAPVSTGYATCHAMIFFNEGSYAA